MPTHLVRAARADDLDALIEFNARLAHETEGKSLNRRTLAQGIQAALTNRDRLAYWVVEVADGSADTESRRVVGQVATTREWSDWRNGWIWWFQSVYVHPDYRNRGIFRALYSHVRGLAQADPQVIGFRLYVEIANESAQRVYRAVGMNPGGYNVFEEIWGAELAGSS